MAVPGGACSRLLDELWLAVRGNLSAVVESIVVAEAGTFVSAEFASSFLSDQLSTVECNIEIICRMFES